MVLRDLAVLVANYKGMGYADEYLKFCDKKQQRPEINDMARKDYLEFLTYITIRDPDTGNNLLESMTNEEINLLCGKKFERIQEPFIERIDFSGEYESHDEELITIDPEKSGFRVRSNRGLDFTADIIANNILLGRFKRPGQKYYENYLICMQSLDLAVFYAHDDGIIGQTTWTRSHNID